MTVRTYYALLVALIGAFTVSLPLFRFVDMAWLWLTIPTGAVIPFWMVLPMSSWWDRLVK